MTRRNRYPSHKKLLIHNAVIQLQHRLCYFLGRTAISLQIRCAMCVLRYFPAVSIPHDLSRISYLRVLQTFLIISNRQHKLICDNSLIYQIKHKPIHHFPHNDFRFFCRIGRLQHLSGAYAVAHRLIGLYIRDRTRFPAPRMINQ